MRLFALTALVMIAFAANSVLTRMAVGGAGLGPAFAAVLRLGAGAVVLVALARLARGPGAFRLAPRAMAAGMATLFLYIFGFSLANGRIDAGLGALTLFGTVQVTMFAGALAAREPVPARRWLGAGLALCGLGLLLWPGGAARPDPAGLAFMIAAGVGWGLYSLAGRRVADPLAATAANFALALLPALGWLALAQDWGAGARWGIWPALLSGAVTSGLGYALWYRVLPRLPASLASLAQLSVPVLAAAGGAVLLHEWPGPRLWAAGALVLGGIGLSLGRPSRAKAAPQPAKAETSASTSASVVEKEHTKRALTGPSPSSD